MRILLVADFTSQPCGIRNFADQTVTALRRHPGLEVDTWDGDYPTAARAGYLPSYAHQYDVIHVNWHPVAFNHYLPEHFPDGPILSVYLHDVPPWSTCPFFERAQVRFTAEPSPGCVELPYPIADWVPLPDPAPGVFSVGSSTVRGEGQAALEAICQAQGWEYCPRIGGQWLTFEAEVQRLARHSVNVLWYDEKRGKSGGLSQALAAGRPVIVSQSPMFSSYLSWHFPDGIFRPTPTAETLPALLDVVHHLWALERLDHFLPTRIREARSWGWATAILVNQWLDARLDVSL